MTTLSELLLSPSDEDMKAAAKAMQRTPWISGSDSDYYGTRAAAALTAALASLTEQLERRNE